MFQPSRWMLKHKPLQTYPTHHDKEPSIGGTVVDSLSEEKTEVTEMSLVEGLEKRKRPRAEE